MNVDLTTRQLERVNAAVTDELLSDWLGRAVQVTHSTWSVWMPAIGWKRIADEMFSHCYDGRGFRNKRVRESDLRALRKIQASVNVRERHPALMKIGALGLVRELVPAWRWPGQNPDGRWYSPYPVLGAPFVVLVPDCHDTGTKHTIWSEGERARDLPLLDDAAHWALMP